MAYSILLIQSMFYTKLREESLEVTVDAENVSSDLQINDLTVVAHLLPSRPLQATLGSGGLNKQSGIFQLTVRDKRGKGYGSAGELVDRILGIFKRGTVLTKDGETIRITKAYVGTGFYDEGKYCLPVSIEYEGYFSN